MRPRYLRWPVLRWPSLAGFDVAPEEIVETESPLSALIDPVESVCYVTGAFRAISAKGIHRWVIFGVVADNVIILSVIPLTARRSFEIEGRAFLN